MKPQKHFAFKRTAMTCGRGNVLRQQSFGFLLETSRRRSLSGKEMFRDSVFRKKFSVSEHYFDPPSSLTAGRMISEVMRLILPSLSGLELYL